VGGWVVGWLLALSASARLFVSTCRGGRACHLCHLHVRMSHTHYTHVCRTHTTHTLHIHTHGTRVSESEALGKATKLATKAWLPNCRLLLLPSEALGKATTLPPLTAQALFIWVACTPRAHLVPLSPTPRPRSFSLPLSRVCVCVCMRARARALSLARSLAFSLSLAWRDRPGMQKRMRPTMLRIPHVIHMLSGIYPPSLPHNHIRTTSMPAF